MAENLINGPENIDLTQGNFLLVFSTSWCGPCQALAPKLKTIAEDLMNENIPVKIVKIDCEADELSKELSKRFNIMSVPTIILLKDNQPSIYKSIKDEYNILLWVKDKLEFFN